MIVISTFTYFYRSRLRVALFYYTTSRLRSCSEVIIIIIVIFFFFWFTSSGFIIIVNIFLIDLNLIPSIIIMFSIATEKWNFIQPVLIFFVWPASILSGCGRSDVHTVQLLLPVYVPSIQTLAWCPTSIIDIVQFVIYFFTANVRRTCLFLVGPFPIVSWIIFQFFFFFVLSMGNPIRVNW